MDRPRNDVHAAIAADMSQPSAPRGWLMSADAGAGLSTALAAEAESAESRGYRLVSIKASRSETAVPYGGLHQIVHASRRLPAARAAQEFLATAMSLPTPDVDRRASDILASLLSSPAEPPVLLVVDDVHHLDTHTASALHTVTEHGDALAVTLLLGTHCKDDTRQGPDDTGRNTLEWRGLRRLHLQPLDDTAAAALLDAHAPTLDSRLRERILREAAGRPLALTELPLAWRGDDTPGADLLLPQSPVTDRLMTSLLDAASLTPAQRHALTLIAAADRGWEHHALKAALHELDVSPDVLDELLATPSRAAPLDDHDGIRLADPLLGAALIRSAPPELLVDIQHTLDRAAISDAPAHLNGAERIRHAAAPFAARRRDETAIASLVAAAETAHDLGRFDVAKTLLKQVPVSANPVDKARAGSLDRRLDEERWQQGPHVRTACDVADVCRSAGNDDLALDLLAGVVDATSWWGLDRPSRTRIWHSLRQFEGLAQDPRWRYCCAHVEPNRLAPAAEPPTPAETTIDAVRAGRAAWRAGDLDATVLVLRDAVARAENARETGLHLEAATTLIAAQLARGDWATLDADIPGTADAARTTGHRIWQAEAQSLTALHLAFLGKDDEARRAAALAQTLLGDRHVWAIRARVAAARGVTLMASGRFQEAGLELEPRLREVTADANPVEAGLLISLYAEACHHIARHDLATGMLDHMRPVLRAPATAATTAFWEHARLLASVDPPEAMLRDVVGAAAEVPLLLARALLHYGAWLRRERRIADARTSLRAAQEALGGLRTGMWAHRIEQELQAAGRSGASEPDTGGLLSPQERAVVHLAANGMTNREIGAALALSPRTVASHLANAYPKLKITSRYQLRARLDERATT